MTAPLAARAQSSALLDTVRIHHPDAQARAREELRVCQAQSCPRAAELSLLAGYLTLSDGDPRAAARQLLALPPPPALDAFHAFYLAEALFYSNDPPSPEQRESGRVRAQRGFARAARVGPTWLARRARAREAETLAGLGRWPEVLLRLEALPDPPSPELLQLRARAEGMLGREDAERADLRAFLLRHPTHPLAEEVAADLAAQNGTQVPFTFDERLARTRRFLDAGAPERAMAELDEIAAHKLARGGTALARVALARAAALFALGKEPEANGALDAALKGPPAVAVEALMLRARRVMKGTDLAAAHDRMAEVARRFAREGPAAEADFLAGWLDLQRGENSAAAEALGRHAERFPRSTFRDDALWFTGLAHLHQGRHGEARRALQKLLQTFPRSNFVAQARYWAARALQLETPTAPELRGEYEDVLRLYAGTVYALFARERLREMQVPTPPLFPTPVALDGDLPPGLRLASALVASGLLRDAADELQSSVGSVRGSSEALAMGHALQRLGEYGQAHTLAARALWGQGFGERRPEALALFFPKPYAHTVAEQATKAHISPFLVYAIMRQESGFEPSRISPANARGLMQLIPPTARAISEQLGRPSPLADELYAPALNLELGAWYLGKLIERFHHPALVAGAYNAGPAAMLRWIAARGIEPLDLFIEDIPYKETRAYVKQVFGDFLNYHLLYGQSQALPAWRWEVPRPEEKGVAF